MFLITDASTGLDLQQSRRPLGLTDLQASLIEQAMPSTWAVDRHVSYDDSLALMICIPGPAGAERHCYVDAETNGFSLSTLQDDDLQYCGCYESLDTLLAAIRRAV